MWSSSTEALWAGFDDDAAVDAAHDDFADLFGLDGRDTASRDDPAAWSSPVTDLDPDVPDAGPVQGPTPPTASEIDEAVWTGSYRESGAALAARNALGGNPADWYGGGTGDPDSTNGARAALFLDNVRDDHGPDPFGSAVKALAATPTPGPRSQSSQTPPAAPSPAAAGLDRGL